MICVGLDVSKGKSTVCISSSYGEIVRVPFNIDHTEEGLSNLVEIITGYNEPVRCVMEATGNYHLPILYYLKKHDLFVSAVNPMLLKKYVNMSIRKVKTDKMDAIRISQYGLQFWDQLKEFEFQEAAYIELDVLCRQYQQYVSIRTKARITLSNLIDRVMPGIEKFLSNSSVDSHRDKLDGFVKKYWHYDNITKKSEKQFVTSYLAWTKKERYRQSEDKARVIYHLALNGVTSMDSTAPSTKMLVCEAVRMIREVDATLDLIMLRMNELAEQLPEYETVSNMGGIGKKLTPQIIAVIGDVRRFHSASALVAYAGIDAPPYQSGAFTGSNRNISKRGSKYLRKIGYQVMMSIKCRKPTEDTAVYDYLIKKESEGKPKKVAKIAALNKFLRIYFARVMEVYQGLETTSHYTACN